MTSPIVNTLVVSDTAWEIDRALNSYEDIRKVERDKRALGADRICYMELLTYPGVTNGSKAASDLVYIKVKSLMQLYSTS